MDKLSKYGTPVRQYLIKKGLIDKGTESRKKMMEALFIDMFDETISKLKKKLNDMKKRDAMSDDAARLAAHLPVQTDIDKICRYEAHLERQLSKSMDQLEKLQRARLGGNAPPPLDLNLKVENVRIYPSEKCETKPAEGEER